MLAHIAGVPVEETALNLAPVAVATAGLAGARLRRIAGRRTWKPWRLAHRQSAGRRP